MRKFLSIIMAICIMSTFFTGCRKDGDNISDGQANNEAVVRFLNFKPEVATVYDEIAKAYKNETGKTLVVETAASGNYEQTLAAKLIEAGVFTIYSMNLRSESVVSNKNSPYSS